MFVTINKQDHVCLTQGKQEPYDLETAKNENSKPKSQIRISRESTFDNFLTF